MFSAPVFSGVSPTIYHPYLNGRYTVSAGLYRLGVQPIEGQTEAHTFAFDRTYPAYISAKVAARTRALHEYFAVAGLEPGLRENVLDFVARRAAQDSGGALNWDGQTLSNRALGWAGHLDLKRGTLEGVRRFPAPLAELVTDVHPLDALDFLAMNVQEDLSILARRPDGSDFLAALHVLLPEKWNPLDKIGRSFAEVHAPVAGSGPMIASAPKLIEAVISRGPFVRFVWGVTPSGELDHHPNLAPEVGLPTDPSRFFLRVERQTLHGFPAQQGALFTIRAYLYPLTELLASPQKADALASGIRSMTPEQLTYKGLTRSGAALLDWLDGRARVDG
ncbi:heme-dependent oxidative N-demethylase subunit alpha family protein [Deinococcus sp.]|uniref:heme-dependent oxidative N-demethylase subunit alpha family protein n=1 Tax=Deinococcus sp. TaxID=47478 RepID=UPI003C79CDE7